MHGDTGIHLFLLLLSMAGMLFAGLSLCRDPVMCGRLVFPDPASGRSCLLLTVAGRRTVRIRLKPSGLFRLTIPSGGRAVIQIVHRRQVVRTLRVSHRADPAQRLLAARPVFDLGDIVVGERAQDRYHMRLHYRAGGAVVVTAGDEPARSAPVDRQLLDHSGQALMHSWDAARMEAPSSC